MKNCLAKSTGIILPWVCPLPGLQRCPTSGSKVITLVAHISKFSHVPKQRVNRQRQLSPGGLPSSATLQAQARQDPEVKPGHQF